MAESKSAALTSLATPQALLVLQERRERLAIQPPHDEAAHFRGHLGVDRPRLALGRKFDEYTGARTAHARITESPEPFEMRRHLRVAPHNHRLEIVAPEPREKLDFLVGFGIRGNSGGAKNSGGGPAAGGTGPRYHALGNSSAVRRSPTPSPKAFRPK